MLRAAEMKRIDLLILERDVRAVTEGLGTLGVVHHGEVTDVMWKSGRIDGAREACKKIRDSGAMVGVSTHIPDVVDHVCSQGWDVAFKILAAGRLCDKPEWVEAAFKSTFEQIKANDAVIVGMYPEYEDQVALNAEYVRRFGSLSK